jgi:hypothetical protein
LDYIMFLVRPLKPLPRTPPPAMAVLLETSVVRWPFRLCGKYTYFYSMNL